MVVVPSVTYPMLFPIVIPPCEGVDSVRVEVDSSGCLRADGTEGVIDVGHLTAGVYTVTAATAAGPASARLTVAK